MPPTYLFCLEMMDATCRLRSDGARTSTSPGFCTASRVSIYHAPVVVGDTLTFEPRVTSVTDKKGGAMTLIVVETGVTNQHGVVVADVSRTIVVRNGRPS